MKLGKLQKSLVLLTLVTSSLVSTAFAPIYAATLTPSQAAIQLAQSSKPNTTSTAKPSTDITITLNGSKVNLSDPILLTPEGSTLLPVRAIAELLSIDVSYGQSYKIAIASDKSTVLEVPLGLSQAVNNNKVVSINNNTQSVLYNSKTYLPLRFMSEQLGLTITYNNTTKTIAILTSGSITTPPSTPTVTPSTGNSPQAVFDRGDKMKEADASHFKAFSSIEEIKKLLPPMGVDYVLQNMVYTTVTMNIDSQEETIEGYTFYMSKDGIGLLGPANTMVMFKDGTYQKGVASFKNGKKLQDVSYFSYSAEKRIVIVKIGTIDTSNFKF